MYIIITNLNIIIYSHNSLIQLFGRYLFFATLRSRVGIMYILLFLQNLKNMKDFHNKEEFNITV